MKTIVPVALLGLAALSPQPAGGETAVEGGAVLLLVGTYTGERSRGIYATRFDPATGRLSAPTLAAETESPSFLALGPGARHLYAVNEIGDFDGESAGAVSAFAVDAATASLEPLSRRSSRGADPCHLSLDPEGRHVLVANYTGGSLAVLPVEASGGLAPASAFVQHHGSSAHPRRQAAPHAHMIAPDPSGRFVLAVDLGLDRVLVYRLRGSDGGLLPHDPPWAALPPGSGPRHLAFHPDGDRVYVVNEMSLTLVTFDWDADRGVLSRRHVTSLLPDGDPPGRGDSAAEVQVHPNGRFLYASVRGRDLIAVFRLDPETGTPSAIQHVPSGGRTPRHFALDPTGRWLLAANQRSDDIAVFGVDPESGRLSPTGHSVEVGTPVCLLFVPPPTRP